MFRFLLGAVVIAAGLFAAVVQMPSVLLTDDSARSATAASESRSCTDTDDGREWNPLRDPAASTSESTWKWRSLHAAFATAAERGTGVAARTETPAPPRAPAASAHLQHIPLLI